MTLLAYGINHLTAPIEIRERLAFSSEGAKFMLKELMREPTVSEAVILSTCNRVEFYSETKDPERLQHWLSNNLNLTLDKCWYSHREKQAVSHIMRVASGLDSMVFGEPQILGQMKDAFNLAQQVGTIGTSFQKLFQRVFSVSKQVRTDTKIGAHPITLGFAAVSLAKQIFSDISKRSALLIGSGDIIELTGLHLYNQGIKRFIIASRSASKAKQLADKLHGHSIGMSEIPMYLNSSDIIISGTASELPILGKGTVESALKARKRQPIFMVDLAVPRDIEPEVTDLEDVYLYNIDDLKTIIDDNQQCRVAAAAEAEFIIDLQAQHYLRDLQALNANELIQSFRNNIERIAKNELQKAKNRLNAGIAPDEVLDVLAHNLINKFSHAPSTNMKQAAFDGRHELLALARQLLDLD